MGSEMCIRDRLRIKINDIVNFAVKSAEASSSEMNHALSAWYSMSDSKKQAIVNKDNREGLYGFTGGCTVEEADNYADGTCFTCQKV